MNILIAIIALNLIIIIHELGHYTVAKLCGIRVLQFSLFMGPKILNIKGKETTFSIGIIPLAAYVLMEGEEEASKSNRAFSNKSVGARAAVIAAGPLANILTAIILISIVYSAVGFDTTKVDMIPKNSPAAQAGIQQGDQIVRYDNKRVYQPMDLLSFLFVSKGKTADIEVRRGGKLYTTQIKPEVIPENRYILGFDTVEPYGAESAVIKEVVPDSPAAKAGLKANDRIEKLNDVAVGSKKEVGDYLYKTKGKPVKITVIRNGLSVNLNATPIMQKNPEQYDIGVGLQTGKGNIFEVLKQALTYTYSTVRSVAYTVVWLVTGKVSLNQFMGPVGMVSIISGVVQQSPSIAILLLKLCSVSAFISLALGATNLIPFPALDGGKLVVLGIEAVTKKPIPPEKEAIVSMIGLGVLLLFGAYTIFNDIMRLVS